MVTNCETDNIAILLGHNNGTFANAVEYFTGARSYSIAIDDFNKDNRSDIAAANYIFIIRIWK